MSSVNLSAAVEVISVKASYNELNSLNKTSFTASCNGKVIANGRLNVSGC